MSTANSVVQCHYTIRNIYTMQNAFLLAELKLNNQSVAVIYFSVWQYSECAIDFIGKKPENVVEKSFDYIAKCDVPGSQRKHCCDNNICMGDCVALIEQSTNGKKCTKGKKVALRHSNYTLAWDRHLRIHTATQSSARVRQCLWTDILPTLLFFNVCNF